LATKAFELAKSFQNWQNYLLSAVKSCRQCAASFSKENCSSETNLTVLKTGEIAPASFSKALGAALRNLLPNRSEGFNSPVSKSFS
jgi:hypothetical protein